DPANPYPDRFTGHVRVVLSTGEVHQHRQDFFRGGVDHPLSDADLRRKFFANCAYGGLTEASAQRLATAVAGLFDMPKLDLSAEFANAARRR
ncbi:MAG TPA: MmgE/PrpD family protein, partial [Burkholderiaceae bacterium]|nr:MmgE/PrpD family protein [Burkholderiaceae bacterium]